MFNNDSQTSGPGQLLEDIFSGMRTIAANTQRIARTIKIINEIAFQASMQALNAGLDADRGRRVEMGRETAAEEVPVLVGQRAQAPSRPARRAA